MKFGIKIRDLSPVFAHFEEKKIFWRGVLETGYVGRYVDFTYLERIKCVKYYTHTYLTGLWRGAKNFFFFNARRKGRK